MAYGSYRRMQKVVDMFGIEVKQGDLFLPTITPIEPSEWLKKTLAKARKVGFVNEKERSERVVYPILSELAEEINDNQITIYSGRDLDVDPSKGLNGECDFLLSLGQKALMLVDAPVFSVVEAKKEDIEYGSAQCAAQMLGIQQYNRQRGQELPFVYGVVTDASEWFFLKLEGKTLTIHHKTFYITEVNLILGAFQFAFDACRKLQVIT
jgi:hypothetical protein